MMLVANKVVWVNNKPVAYEIINEYCAEKESMFHFVKFIFNMEESQFQNYKEKGGGREPVY